MAALAPALLAAGLALPTPAAGATTEALAGGDLEVTLTVLETPGGRDGADALLDVGTVSARWQRAQGARRPARGIVVSSRVGVRVTSRTGRRGFVRLRASLATPEARGTVSVDGIVLATVPRLLDAQVPIGPVVTRQVELELDASQPEGTFTTQVVWEVEDP